MSPVAHVTAALVALGGVADGTVSLRFASTSAALTGLSDSQGAAGVNGLAWGILIDTAGDGFKPLSLPLDVGPTSGQSTTWNGDDVFFYCGTTTGVPIGSDQGPGSPGIVNALDVYSNPNVSSGDRFALIWFNTGIAPNDAIAPGHAYGILENSGLILPPDGSATTSYQTLFAGPDPVRPANLTVAAAPPADASTSIVEIDPGGGNPVTRHLAITFTANVTTLAATAVELEKSTTLLPDSWSFLSETFELLQDNGATRVFRVVDPDPIGTDPRRFVRLKVTP